MIFRNDFRKLVSVCLKMLFRKSTRLRFAFLVFAFLFMMGFNTGGYVKKFHQAEISKKEVLEEKAFKIFFLRMNTRNNFAGFLNQHKRKIEEFGAIALDKAFIYQNNLYIHLYPSVLRHDAEPEQGKSAMNLLVEVLGLDAFTGDLFFKASPRKYMVVVKNHYFDHNGALLEKDTVMDRDEDLKGDLRDIADAIRGDLRGKRLETFNQIKNRIIDDINRVAFLDKEEPNPYLSRLQAIVPLNLLYILTNIRIDNTTDILDLPKSVRFQENASVEVFKEYLEFPEFGPVKALYGDIEEIFPRYLPLVVPDLIKPQWNWLLYEQILLKKGFMTFIDQLHFKGHYLFSYEKLHIIKDKIKKLNDDIRMNHIYFYLTDLSMGVVFPFIMSLFAFIHLKTEISFLLMSKNRIKEILFIFWILPVLLMLFIKSGVISVYWLYLYNMDAGVNFYLVYPLLIAFFAAAGAFYPVNKWCFIQFTGGNLNLYELHKGR